ncbi:putative sulfate/molybdate transporter [Promethearchaeum syntrophicum]|uniref:Sulfate/molybdate transporter n=1 Tax=Promethearchaeum syntrophicum TaxID=2594042 RepID=A0A5B9D7U2_9ARCH|nr:putative sulfate/molybdate transporter [Candidatus Prometheoarchaeum syntrophicum]QEE15194.1 hypothetical protein DSAG12_01018 [Candidatus Prometheoarchaeum syntrophicum]
MDEIESIVKEKKNNQEKKFTLKEFGGAFGDWGTLIPYIIGYISIVGLHPAGIFLCLGITNIVLGLRYNLPLPVQPQKTIGAIAISTKWAPNMVISTGFGTGIIWLLLGFSKKLNNVVKLIPIVSVRGIQLGLALLLGHNSIIMFSDNLLLGFISVAIILIFIKSKKIPSAIILTIFGVILLIVNGVFQSKSIWFSLPIFEFHIPTWDNLFWGMIYAGFGQLFLTLTNVMVATVILIRDLFPNKSDKIDANSLSFNMGVLNTISPFVGGIPLCHGSGGLAAQYAFGARSGGSMILEGIMEIVLGLFFSNTLFIIFSEFPQAILGAMLLYTATLLVKVSFKEYNSKNLPIILLSATFAYFFNISIGFLVGLGLNYILKAMKYLT